MMPWLCLVLPQRLVVLAGWRCSDCGEQPLRRPRRRSSAAAASRREPKSGEPRAQFAWYYPQSALLAAGCIGGSPSVSRGV